MRIKIPKIPKKIQLEASMKMLYGCWGMIKVIAKQESLSTIDELSNFIDQMSPSDLEKYQINKGENNHEIDYQSGNLEER